MPVTEFALLHLSHPPPPRPGVLSTLADAMRLQTAWHAARFPQQPSSAAARAAVWFTQAEDPARLLTTARWASTAAHWEWIRSEANRGVMAGLVGGGEIVGEDTVLFHVEGEFFGVVGSPLLKSPVISLSRIFISRGKREAFVARFGEVKGILEGYAGGSDLVRCGWRDDVEEGAQEDEFVLVCGWESVEKHLAFPECPGFAEFDAIQELISRVDLKHYRPLLLE
ncbi:hypothetical protein C8A05DRAFT_17972 [Staphylotrichum tortipilum]|uniref:ABM domain-containing protein n=1 Tax=Staphylotrichum tortipilum TaxID=2831512 RepID=A0AAN6RQE8_9PEZI|nr:hypothetical protein C8A05DRAFT_17972 [Staphylotrichum longicolle]